MVVVVEVTENAPTDVDVEHLNAFFIEGEETLLVNKCHFLLLQFHLDHLLNLLQIFELEVAVEYSVLQIGHLLVR